MTDKTSSVSMIHKPTNSSPLVIATSKLYQLPFYLTTFNQKPEQYPSPKNDNKFSQHIRILRSTHATRSLIKPATPYLPYLP